MQRLVLPDWWLFKVSGAPVSKMKTGTWYISWTKEVAQKIELLSEDKYKKETESLPFLGS